MDSETPREARSSQRATRARSGTDSSSAPRDRDGNQRATERSDRVPEGGEEFGPLAVERHRKDDGRALLLYELRDDPR